MSQDSGLLCTHLIGLITIYSVCHTLPFASVQLSIVFFDPNILLHLFLSVELESSKARTSSYSSLYLTELASKWLLFSIIWRLSQIILYQFWWLEIKPYSPTCLYLDEITLWDGWKEQRVLQCLVKTLWAGKCDVNYQDWKYEFYLQHWKYCRWYWNVTQKMWFHKNDSNSK